MLRCWAGFGANLRMQSSILSILLYCREGQLLTHHRSCAPKESAGACEYDAIRSLHCDKFISHNLADLYFAKEYFVTILGVGILKTVLL